MNQIESPFKDGGGPGDSAEWAGFDNGRHATGDF